MQRDIVKVYGYLTPCEPDWLPGLKKALRFLGEEADGALCFSGGLLNISYEGVYFPLEEFLEVLAPLLTAQSRGKLDYIDMEAWRLTRYNFENGFITSSARDLNDVLAYSGH